MNIELTRQQITTVIWKKKNQDSHSSKDVTRTGLGRNSIDPSNDVLPHPPYQAGSGCVLVEG